MEREKSLEGKSAQIECFSHGANYPADVVAVAPPYITMACPVVMPEGDKVIVRVRADEPLVFSAIVEEQLDFGAPAPRQLLRITSPIRVEDQRQAERINSGALRCFWRYEGCNYEGVLLDVSEAGAAIQSTVQMADAAVEVRIPAAAVAFEAEVANCTLSGPGRYRVGLQYIFPDEQTIKKLVFAAAESNLVPTHKLHRLA